MRILYNLPNEKQKTKKYNNILQIFETEEIVHIHFYV